MELCNSSLLWEESFEGQRDLGRGVVPSQRFGRLDAIIHRSLMNYYSIAP